MATASSARPIDDVASDLGIAPDHLILYGRDKAKIALDALASGRPNGRLVLVSAITPTDAGEGKTTTSIGLAQGLARTGRRACLALREPSLGPTFGQKGGATGGGLAHLVPESDINLHFTGDFHAISAAHNLLAAMLDNHMQQGNARGIDPRRVTWRRVIDMNDRSLVHRQDPEIALGRSTGGRAARRLRDHRAGRHPGRRSGLRGAVAGRYHADAGLARFAAGGTDGPRGRPRRALPARRRVNGASAGVGGGKKTEGRSQKTEDRM